MKRNASTFWEALVYALRGWREGLVYEKNLKIELVAAALALGLGLWLKLSLVELAIVALAGGAVVALELVNTAIESLADVVQPRSNKAIRLVKDVAAGAVLLAVLVAVIVGLMLLGPPLVAYYT